MTPDEVQRGFDLHRAGRLAEAEAIYRRCLAETPDHHAVLHMLGVLQAYTSQFPLAIASLERAIALCDTAADYHSHLAGALVEVGRFDDAVRHCRRALELDPDSANAHSILGSALFRMGRLGDAVVSFRRALQIQPTLVSIHRNLSSALQQLGRIGEAIASYRQIVTHFPSAESHCRLALLMNEAGRLDDSAQSYRRALALDADHPDARKGLAAILRRQGRDAEAASFERSSADDRAADEWKRRGVAMWMERRWSEAADAFRHARSLRPDDPETHSNLGAALQEMQSEDEAIECYRRAIALNPDFAEALDNLGTLLHLRGDVDEAVACHRKAFALKPTLVAASVNLGAALKDQGKLDEAIALYRGALEAEPNSPAANIHLAFAQLLAGDLPGGFARYEWRWRNADFSSAPRNFPQPLWRGEPLNGATILLHAEQGLGDTLQFVRYVPMVVERGGRVVVEGQGTLGRLLKRTVAGAEWVDAGQPLPSFAVRSPLMSLPAVFGTSLETVPRKTPYVWPDAADVEAWHQRLGEGDGTMRVGVVWFGRAKFKFNRHRSMTLRTLAPLGRIPGVQLFSLQKGEQAQEALQPPEGMKLIDWTHELRDFADTAALIANLDLVITVDTSVAHLAGAMGKPTWTLLAFAPDWRWLLGRDDCPWYPSMRLFRQPKAGDWESVVERVAAELNVQANAAARDPLTPLVPGTPGERGRG